VRNHLPVPLVAESDYVLTVTGEGLPTKTLTLSELKANFAKHTVDATIQCAVRPRLSPAPSASPHSLPGTAQGNRRNELSAVKPVKGGAWDIGAISNASWGGARLRDVLLWLGVSDDAHAGTDSRAPPPLLLSRFAAGLYHVQFEGLDRDMEKNYGASIPIEKALDRCASPSPRLASPY